MAFFTRNNFEAQCIIVHCSSLILAVCKFVPDYPDLKFHIRKKKKLRKEKLYTAITVHSEVPVYTQEYVEIRDMKDA